MTGHGLLPFCFVGIFENTGLYILYEVSMRKLVAVTIVLILVGSGLAFATEPKGVRAGKNAGAKASDTALEGIKKVSRAFAEIAFEQNGPGALPEFYTTPEEEEAAIDLIIAIYEEQYGKTLTREQAGIAVGLMAGVTFARAGRSTTE